MISVLSRRSGLAAFAAIPMLLAAKPLSPALAGGTTYEFIVHGQTAQTRGTDKIMMRGRGTFAGGDGRIDILETMSPAGTFGSAGSYFLVREGGKKMLMVDPTNKQYMEWDMANMLAGMSKMVNAVGGLMKFEMSDIKIDSHNLGAGETLQGYPTVHYQMTENYTMNIKIFGRGSKTHTETTADYYFAPRLKGLSNPFMSNSRAMAQSFDMFNNPDYKTQMAAAMAKIDFGVPVKMVMHTVSTDDKGKQQTSIVTSEMVNFKNIDIPRSTFAIPDDYKLIEMPKLDANLAVDPNAPKTADVNADSIAKAAKEGTKDAVKDAAKEAGKEAAKSKIRGIFKR
jgi:hypothetical protein